MTRRRKIVLGTSAAIVLAIVASTVMKKRNAQIVAVQWRGDAQDLLRS